MVNNTESSTMRILLIRHGETDWNRTHRFQGRSDLPLNQMGREQAHALALGLKDQSLTAIYSSPLVRAVETACLIKVFHPSVPFFKEGGLAEMDLGEFEGMEAGQWVAEHPDFIEAWRETPATVRMPGGENLQEVQARAVSTLERIAKLYPMGSTLLLCSHNFVIRTILCYALHIPLDRFREVRQETAALNVLHIEGTQLVAKMVNDCSHLTDYGKNEAK
jgi:broad specificity phosphatase PhoE